MKRHLLTFLLVVVSFVMFAQSTTKIYINPGHGGWDSDDRYQALPPYGKVESSQDTLAFWESSSNLDKGLILYHMLDSLNKIPGEDGWEFMISRTLNRTEDDRSLSAIVEESNAFNSNFMLSIHSNAGNPSNYPLMLYSGVDEGDDLNAYNHKVTEVNNAEGRAVSKMIGDNIRGLSLVPWTNAMQLRGDKTFAKKVMGWEDGYGVLRWLTTPGVISEGRMHDYAPETYRLMNHDYRWLEAWHFLHAFVHYYKGRTLKTGNIAGDVRDKFISAKEIEAYGQLGKYFRPDTRDAMMPLNGTDVKLIQNGDTIRRYKTDEYFNSFWLFNNLEAGTYEVELSKEGYHNYKQEVVVKADETTYVTVDMQAIRSTPPEIIAFYPANNEVDSVACNESIVIDWNWSMDTESVEAAFSIEPKIDGVFEWSNYGRRLTFKPTPSFNGNTLYTVRIATTAAHPDTAYENTLQEEYVSKFLTNSYDTLNLLASSPTDGDVIPVNSFFFVLFDSKLNSATARNYINVVDEKGNSLEKSTRKQYWNKLDGYGSYQFKLNDSIVVGKTYRLLIEPLTENEDGIATRVKREIPFTFANFTEPMLEKAVDCSTIMFEYDEKCSEQVVNVKVTKNTEEILFKVSNKLTYSFVDTSAISVVEYKLKTPMEVENDVDLSIPVKGDFTYNKLLLKYVNEDASDSIYADFITLSNFSWNIYNVRVDNLPSDNKKWYLSAVVVEESGHPANGFKGEFYIENIYLGKYELPVGVEQVKGDGVSVWPNPAAEFIYVDAPENASIELYSIDGRLITSVPAENVASEDNVLRTIGVNNLTAGTYIVNISTANGSQTLKFVKY